MTAADHTGQADETYDFDLNGNRDSTGFVTGANNRTTSDGTYNYTYDDEGNRLTKTNISSGDKEEYTWDHRNRLVTITFKNSGGTVVKTVDQTYDIFNRWIGRSVDPDGATGSAAVQNTYFVFDAAQVLFQFDGSSASDLTHRYLWNPMGTDHLFAAEEVSSLGSAGNVLHPLGDHLNTNRDIAQFNSGTNTTTVVNHRDYDTFGRLLSETNAAVDLIFGYTGKALDEATGLQNNVHRWLDSWLAQWVSEDPIGIGGNDPNFRRYVGNEPVSSTDPSGLVDTNHEAFRDFLGRWGVGQYLTVHHIFRQEFYDKDPVVGPYLQSHGFMKDDIHNLMPLPNKTSYSNGYQGDQAAHLGGHCGESTNTLHSNITLLKNREDAGSITREQAAQQLLEIQRAERKALRANPSALHKSETVAKHQAMAAQVTSPMVAF